jgi:hypothetical protein
VHPSETRVHPPSPTSTAASQRFEGLASPTSRAYYCSTALASTPCGSSPAAHSPYPPSLASTLPSTPPSHHPQSALGKSARGGKCVRTIKPLEITPPTTTNGAGVAWMAWWDQGGEGGQWDTPIPVVPTVSGGTPHLLQLIPRGFHWETPTTRYCDAHQSPCTPWFISCGTPSYAPTPWDLRGLPRPPLKYDFHSFSLPRPSTPLGFSLG